MSRTLDNTTGSDIDIQDAGATVEVGVQYTIDPYDYLKFSESEDIDPFLDSGDLVFKLNGVTLQNDIAKCVLHEVSPFIEVDNNGSLVKVAVQRLSLIGDLGATIKDNKTVEIEAGLGSGTFGSLVSVTCINGDPDCIIDASLLVDYTICGIKRKDC